jgi:hypothetical protein
MDAPKCEHCGKRHWERLCPELHEGGRRAREPGSVRPAEPARLVDVPAGPPRRPPAMPPLRETKVIPAEGDTRSRGGGESRPAPHGESVLGQKAGIASGFDSRGPAVTMTTQGTGVASGPREQVRRGRPLAKDAHLSARRTKPWEAEGIGRTTWYKRRAEARKAATQGEAE